MIISANIGPADFEHPEVPLFGSFKHRMLMHVLNFDSWASLPRIHRRFCTKSFSDWHIRTLRGSATGSSISFSRGFCHSSSDESRGRQLFMQNKKLKVFGCVPIFLRLLPLLVDASELPSRYLTVRFQ